MAEKGEALALKWPEVNFEKRTLQVIGTLSLGAPGEAAVVTTPKTKRSKRTFGLPDDALSVLKKRKEDEGLERLDDDLNAIRTDEGFVFCDLKGAPLNFTSLARVFDELIKGAGVTRIPPHSLRHTYASLTLANGKDISVVSEMLGHASVQTTYDIYRHVIPGESAKVADDFQKMLDNTTPT